jgi:hypothetical protein
VLISAGESAVPSIVRIRSLLAGFGGTTLEQLMTGHFVPAAMCISAQLTTARASHRLAAFDLAHRDRQRGALRQRQSVAQIQDSRASCRAAIATSVSTRRGARYLRSRRKSINAQVRSSRQRSTSEDVQINLAAEVARSCSSFVVRNDSSP